METFPTPSKTNSIPDGSVPPKEPGPVAFSPATATVPPATSRPLQESWPKSAQWTAAVLLGGVVILLACHALAGIRAGTRASEHVEPDGPIYRMDLNRARRAELVQLPGVGPKLAQRIVTYRQTKGPFRSVDELGKVSGIGPKTLERLRPWVCVDFEQALPTPAVESLVKVTEEKPVRARLPQSKSKKEANLSGQIININEASAAELQRLPRIGPKMSQRIIDERDKARFESVDALRRVKGIGPKTLARLRPYITVGSQAPGIASAKRK